MTSGFHTGQISAGRAIKFNRHVVRRTWFWNTKTVQGGRSFRDGKPCAIATRSLANMEADFEHAATRDVENRIKKLHHGLEIDRTSCTRFWANQFRVMMTAAAYALMQELRLRAAGTSCCRAQVSTLRERLIKLGVHVVVSVRRIVLHLPASFAFLDTWRRVALALSACAG